MFMLDNTRFPGRLPDLSVVSNHHDCVLPMTVFSDITAGHAHEKHADEARLLPTPPVWTDVLLARRVIMLILPL